MRPLSRGAKVVILDLHLPGMEGPEAVRFTRAAGAEVLVLSASDDRAEVIEAIGAGAAGYLTKSADTDEIIQAIQTVSRGGTYVSPVLAGHLLNQAKKHDRTTQLVLTPRVAGDPRACRGRRDRRRHRGTAFHQRPHGPLTPGSDPGENGSSSPGRPDPVRH